MMVMVGGAAIAVRDEGAGPPTLFLHGNPDSSDLWTGLIDALRGEFRCLAPDLPGFGDSAVPANFDPTLSGMARFVDDLATALGLTGSLNLVGHDFGAQFALAWAIEHPERVRRVVVANSNFFSDYRWHRIARLFRMPLVGELLMALTNDKALARTLRADAPGLSEAHIRRAAARYGPAAKRMALRLYRAGDPAQFRGWEERLPGLAARVPLGVIWGDRDRYAPPGLAERFGGREVWHFPDAGHWAVAEAAEQVAPLLRAFLR